MRAAAHAAGENGISFAVSIVLDASVLLVAASVLLVAIDAMARRILRCAGLQIGVGASSAKSKVVNANKYKKWSLADDDVEESFSHAISQMSSQVSSQATTVTSGVLGRTYERSRESLPGYH